MLKKPDFPDGIIIARVQTEYGLHVSQIAFLPLGASRASISTSLHG
jgi:hypothetical protein